ncbi:N-acetylmuramoyl-L-alanine amidase [Bacillus licheniformis]|nr:N-acetylmuramoyl-L-alanine amidase [Bacillus licheniformis]
MVIFCSIEQLISKGMKKVKLFQLMQGLSADGIYGPKTKAKLESLLK